MAVKWVKTLKIETHKIHSIQYHNQTKMVKADSQKEQNKKHRKILKMGVLMDKLQMNYQREMILHSRYLKAHTQVIF